MTGFKIEKVIDIFSQVRYNKRAVKNRPWYAGMAELADAPDLGSGVPDVQVQVLLPAPCRSGGSGRRARFRSV